MKHTITPPSVSMKYGQTGASTRMNELGMRTMQERAYQKRGEQYLLIKSPPASGKSRALMFIALDKLRNQGIRQAIIAVPERSIGGSFGNTPLSQNGYSADWHVAPQWNLCNVAGVDDARIAKSKVKAVGAFLQSADEVLVCTHATLRFAVEALGIEAFDARLIAVDEFHHVSSEADNVLGTQLSQFIARDKVHIVAMTGSYFRGDAAPVLSPTDEARFDTVTYTYYEQLNGYEHLKALDMGYFFYSGSYLDSIIKVLDPGKKTIVHIPSVNSRETPKDKLVQADEIMGALGTWSGKDDVTGFDLVTRSDGRVLKIANLVDDDAAKRDRVMTSLKDPAANANRDHVDIILALGMAKEGFDWIWCEHALTVGYRNSLTEIIQIIGRATRDAPGKTRARFTNLIAEPDASEDTVIDAVNDTLKAISASLLMEQVLAPRFTFTPKSDGAKAGCDYGASGYTPDGTNIGFNGGTGQLHVEIKGLVEPESPEARRICNEDLNEVIAAFTQDTRTMARGLFDEELAPQELTLVRMGKVVRDKYPDLSETDLEAIRQRAVAALNIVQQGRKHSLGDSDDAAATNTAFVDGVRRFAMDVRELDIDLIDSKNPFEAAYALLAKTMDENLLKQVQQAIAARRSTVSAEDARDLAVRAVKFKRERGQSPSMVAADPWEKMLAEGAAAFARHKKAGAYE